MSAEVVHTWIVLLSSLVGLVIISRLAQSGRLSFRYTLGWICIISLIFLSAPSLRLIEFAGGILRLAPPSVFAVISLTLLLTITIQLSISISGLHEHVRTLNEEVSFLRLGAQQDSTAEISHGVVLVIVPAFNEQATITQVVDDIRTNGYDVLVISDGSTDDTVKMAINGGATVLDFRLNMGVGAALRAGFKYAHQNGYQAVVQVDADGQHLVSEIPKLLRPWKEDGFHLVIGSRFRSQGTTMVVSRSRRLAMNMLAFFASRAAHTTITDASSGFRLISQPLLGVFSTTFPASYLGDTYEALISAGKANYKIIEVPTAMSPRLVGVSSASTIKAFGLTVRALLVGILCFHIRISKYKTP